MKKLVLISLSFLFCALLFGCSVNLPAYTKAYYVDYSRYQSDDFFISSLSDYSGQNYIPIGFLEVEHGEPSKVTVIYTTSYTTWDITTSQKVLDMLVDKAKQLGANGIIDVKIERYYTVYHQNEIRQPYVTASGVAIVINRDAIKHVSTEMVNEDGTIPIVTEIADSARMNIVSKTVPFLISQQQELCRPGTDDYEVYDINAGKYIPVDEYIQKYGQQTYDELCAEFEKKISAASKRK